MPTSSSEDGFSLVEVLISVVIMGICFAGLLAGMGTSALSSGLHRGQADGHTLLVSAAEAVRDQQRNPFSCATSGYDLTEEVVLPDGWSASDVRIVTGSIEHGYWDGNGFAVAASCGSGTDMQRMQVEVTTPDGRTSERISLIKRRP